ncbi:uncharacterized protein K02A2.6-like [Anopheles stephensi]|uniref:uncharacterized protein K02A2.6-like n=1 Tax=Anopheles stephensi TaxID=30069 RepID=UPI0016588E95|nr:uncharacterized protein K02A2.6-like [Anopheles stephensi]
MKSLARSYVYWPGIDKDIEQLAKSCHECAQTASAPPKFNKHHWEYPSNAWERVHIDYAGPVADAMLLIIVDAYSKWVEVKITHSTTTEATIKILDDIFASYGAPVTVVTDNGPQFTSEDFSNFLQRSGVKFHKRSAPYHPATNGQAERYVQTVKRALKAMHSTSATLQANLNKFLLQYRKAPHSETGEPPAKLFLGRNIRSRIDLQTFHMSDALAELNESVANIDLAIKQTDDEANTHKMTDTDAPETDIAALEKELQVLDLRRKIAILKSSSTVSAPLLTL